MGWESPPPGKLLYGSSGQIKGARSAADPHPTPTPDCVESVGGTWAPAVDALCFGKKSSRTDLTAGGPDVQVPEGWRLVNIPGFAVLSICVLCGLGGKVGNAGLKESQVDCSEGRQLPTPNGKHRTSGHHLVQSKANLQAHYGSPREENAQKGCGEQGNWKWKLEAAGLGLVIIHVHCGECY